MQDGENDSAILLLVFFHKNIESVKSHRWADTNKPYCITEKSLLLCRNKLFRIISNFIFSLLKRIQPSHLHTRNQ